MLTNALAEQYHTSAILMRRLIPRRLYPGNARVGATLTSMRYRPDVAVYDGVDYFWIPSLVRAIGLLRRERPTTVVFQWWSGTVLHSFLVLAAASRMLGAQIVVEFHETLDTAELQIPFVGAYVRWLSRPFIAMTSAGFVHSTTDVEPVRQRFPGLRDKPVQVIAMGSHDTTVDPQRWLADRTAPTEQTPFQLLYFGTIRPYKGLENLIRAFDSLTHAEVAELHLTIVGETWQNWDLPARLIAESRYRDRITFVNTYVTDEQVVEFFREADALVLPYLRSSGSGPLHMAMSSGLPVAVTAVGGLVESVQGYTGARLVRPADVDDLARALLELPSMPGPHQDPHSWERTTGLLSELLV